MNKQKVNGTIEHVHKNFRYKIFNSDQGIFLIDLHQNIWSYLFPFLNWLPLKAVKLTEEEYQHFKASNDYRKVNKRDIFKVGGYTVLFSSLLRYFKQTETESISILLSILSVIVMLSVITLFYCIIRKKLYIDNTNYRTHCYRLRINLRLKIKVCYILAYVFFWLILSLLLNIVLGAKEFNIFMYISLILYALVVSMFNSVALYIGEVKAVVYKKFE
ncbi:DUF443 family protein [Staphylococcus agnetis]|uniref:DUF443 family protein n=1 Tax=Staphylococcus agnetis TaxID=985762 RepID=UPI000D1B37E0|nr:DUF443 family protein [Staphylococcus agnetis]PTH74099.1 hypothetical protein BU581_02570 [Staphylococcus agnetis]PTH75384.1 hypothetical protein BU580_03255 [Staphylococcus agnetis]